MTMQFDEYQGLAFRTEASVSDDMRKRLDSPFLIRLLHGAMGVCTEAGELQDALKRHIFYGKPIDLVNVSEEVGDVLWYLALIANALGLSLSTIAEANIDKLRTRYPQKFTEADALHRNLEAERKTLESGADPA